MQARVFDQKLRWYILLHDSFEYKSCDDPLREQVSPVVSSMMPSSPKPFPEPVTVLLQTSFLRIKAPTSADYLWERVLTAAQRKRLGNDLEAAYSAGGTVGIWTKLHGVSKVRAVIDVSRALNFLDDVSHTWLLRETGEAVDDPEDILTRVVPSADLVLIERPRQAFWRGGLIEIDWAQNDAPWNYLWELGRATKQGILLDRDAFSDAYARDYLTKMKSRVSRMSEFPIKFSDLILAGGNGTQRLNVPRQSIRLFRMEEISVVREWDGMS